MTDHRSAPRATNQSPIARIRRARGMTQGQLAEAVGVYPKDVSRWETGSRNPRPQSLKRIAEILECSMEELIE